MRQTGTWMEIPNPDDSIIEGQKEPRSLTSSGQLGNPLVLIK